jgi:hypothetical protein
MKHFLRHFFVPHHTNNHRAKILHHHYLLSLIVVFFLGSFLVSYVKSTFPAVLGASVNIAVEDLLKHTNEERDERGRTPLILNERLSVAALKKADHMLSNDYWAHNSPDGTTPWKFIKESGYVYVYAGENLARGFSESGEVVNAWMASPTHRDNMLSNNYQDVGFAIVAGNLNGEDTVLVVEMFGGRKSTVATQNPSLPLQNTTNANLFSSVLSNSVINSNFWAKNISIGVLVILIGTLLLDLFFVERKKIVRIIGIHIDHIVFLSVIIIFIIIISQGVVA